MEPALRARMLFHGIVVILLGLLAGIPFALVISGDLVGELRAWRMAHLEGVLNGLVVLAVAALGGVLSLSAVQQRWLAASLIVAAYANVVASVVAATFGVRGLEPSDPASNLLVFALFALAIVGVLLGLGLAAWGARRWLKEERGAQETSR